MAETTVLRSSSINRTPNAGAKPQAQLSGALPPVVVNMNSGGPQIQGGQGTARQGVTLLPPKGARRNFSTGGLPNQPAKQSVVILPPKIASVSATSSPLTADQLLLCRHLADKYLGDLRAAAGEAQLDEAAANNAQLAEATIAAIDVAMVAITAAAAAAATAAAAAAAAAAPPPQRVVAAGPRTSQAVAAATPRRVPRPPPVIVKMDGGQPVPDVPDVAVTELIEGDAQV